VASVDRRREWGRVAFATAWIAAQVALVATAGRRPDGAFGFRMFSESTTIRVALYREITGATAAATETRIHVDAGTWSARDASGVPKQFSWYDRVWPNVAVFDREVHASYGEAAQLARLQRAVDDVAAHIGEDSETRRLLLEVSVRRNGREPRVVLLASGRRDVR